MNQDNPYLPPEPTAEEIAEQTIPVPETFGQALRQGAKLGFKWGNRAGIAISAAILILLVAVFVVCWIIRDRHPPDMPTWKDCLAMVAGMLYFYVICCVVTIVTGVSASLAIHLVRKAIGAMRRG